MFALFAALLFGTAAHADDFRVEVPDDIHHLTLVCGNERIDREHADGEAISGGKLAFLFPIYPGRECTVILVQTVDNDVEQIGTWNCTSAGCTRTDSGTGPVTVRPGELKILMSADLTSTELELSCLSGFRSRVPLVEHEATFTDVSTTDECTLTTKGGAPLKFKPISPGAWQCYLVSGTLLCKPR